MEKTAYYLRTVGALLTTLGDDAPAAYEEARDAAGAAADSKALAVLATPDSAVRRRLEREVLAGGAAAAVLPVESLYKPWAACGSPGDGAEFGAARHQYMGDAAWHVRALCDGLDLTVPDAFAAMPDHAALLCELAALYAEAGNAEAVRTLLADHFDWLGAYREALAQRQEAVEASPAEALGPQRRDELVRALAHGRRLAGLLDEIAQRLATSLDERNR